jgi:hypothetical protein
MIRQGGSLWSGLIYVALLNVRVLADPIYAVTVLGTGVPVALNDAAQVVLNDAGRVILWQSGVRQELFTGSAVALNNQGEVAGRSAGRAVLYRSGGLVDLGVGTARTLNDLGVVLVDDGDTIFSWQNGVTTELPALVDLGLRSTNNNGWVVGEAGFAFGEPFYFDGSVVRRLRAEGFATDINNNNAFVYIELTDDGNILYLRDGSTTINLGALDPFDTSNQVNALNDFNLAVGGSGGAGFLWQAGVMYDLNVLLLPQDQAEWFIATAVDINGLGDILAWGVSRSTGGLRALLLRQVLAPAIVPEPSSSLLALAGLTTVVPLFVLGRRRVRPRPAP